MTSLVLLAVIGVVEAAVYQGRYRATHGSPRAAGLWTFAVCVLRVAFVGLGVSALLGEAGLGMAALAYALPAAVVTGVVRASEIRRDGGDA